MQQWFNILAIFFSPVVAVIVSFWIGEKMRWRNYQKQREDEILKSLIAFRHEMANTNFLGALNSVVLVFDRNEKIKTLVKDLHRAYANSENQKIIDQRVVELIYEICKYKRYNITEHEIYNLFKSVNPVPSTLEKQINHSSGSSTLNNEESGTPSGKTESSTKCSLTAGYLSSDP